MTCRHYKVNLFELINIIISTKKRSIRFHLTNMAIPTTYEGARQLLVVAVLHASEKKLRELWGFGDRQWDLCKKLRNEANDPSIDVEGRVTRSQKLKKIIERRSNPDNWQVLHRIVQDVNASNEKDSDWHVVQSDASPHEAPSSDSSDDTPWKWFRPDHLKQHTQGNALQTPPPGLGYVSEDHVAWNNNMNCAGLQRCKWPTEWAHYSSNNQPTTVTPRVSPSVAFEISKKVEQLPLDKQLVIQDVVNAMLNI